MGTRTADETEATTSGAEAPEVAEPGQANGTGTEADEAAGAKDDQETAAAVTGEGAEPDRPGGEKGPFGVGQGAGALVSAALGLVSLSGSWIGTVAGAREQLVGQLRTSTSASVATQIKEVYGDAWHTTALWGGLFALAALVVGVVVLARPAFGAPGRAQAPWVKSAAWAGVVLGVVGLLLAVLKYTDALLGLPSA
ncbi:hypothetical protein ACF1B0_31750 [Streptomyces anandii]|uniref:hypothetical protein n=1 Tax=Streptomyces anandii TaxID=285454 RepID=UPI0036FC90EF